MTDPEATAAVEAIERQLRDRDPGTDDEVFAREIIVMLQGRGWRPTEAKRPPHWKQPRPGPAEDTYSRGLAAARESLGGAA
jgi:hypothetical protein